VSAGDPHLTWRLTTLAIAVGATAWKYTKLDVNDRAAAVAAAYERGLITPGVE